jgi:hypothetical protein
MEDLDVNDYSFDEMKEILGLENVNPVTRQDIVTSVQNYVFHYEMNEQMIKFLNDVQTTMINMLNAENQGSGEDTFLQEDLDNPKIGNTYYKLVVIDSQYISSHSSTTDFTCHFPEPIKNVLSFALYSYTIPYSYYNVAASTYNHFFSVLVKELKIEIIIPDGHYDSDTLITAINNEFTAKSFDDTTAAYSHTTGKISLTFSKYKNKELKANELKLLFFDPQSRIGLNSTSSTRSFNTNNTFGWLLGFRKETYSDQLTFCAESVMTISATKYFVVDVEDFCHHHRKTNLIGIEKNPVLSINSLPSYYQNVVNNGTQTQTVKDSYLEPIKSLNVKDNFPRSLTFNQLYAVNEILKHQQTKPSYMLTNFLTQRSFAVIPVKHPKKQFNEVYVEFGGSLQDNKRVYNGPVKLSKLKITLLDDKGQVINLNGADWSMVLKFEIYVQEKQKVQEKENEKDKDKDN